MKKIYRKSVCLAASAMLFLSGTTLPAQAGLIGLYQFDDASNLGKDTSGNHNDATDNGATFTNSGYQGGAAHFDGSSFLSVAIDVNPTVLPQMTWGAWVKPDVLSASTVQTVLSSDNGGFDRTITIDYRGGGGASSFSAYTSSGVWASGVAPSTSQWEFVAAVYDASKVSLTFYANGQSFQISSSFGPSQTFFDIGNDPSFGQLFLGSIDNVFVYDQALTASQIATIQSNGFPPASTVPEPSSFALMGLGGLGLAIRAMKRRRASVV